MLFKRRLKCPHCKRRNGKLQNDNNRAIILDFSGRSEKKKKKEAEKRKKEQETREAQEHARQLIEEGDQPDFEQTTNADTEEKKDDKKLELKEQALLDPMTTTKNSLEVQLHQVNVGVCDKLVWRGAEVREHFRVLWEHDGDLLKKLFPMLEEHKDACPLDVLFCEVIMVPPTKYRPIRLFQGDRFEHPQTVNLRRILEADQLLQLVKASVKDPKARSTLKDIVDARVMGRTMNEKLHNAYVELQVRANCLYDSESAWGNKEVAPGIKQLLEKKQGLFRMHMMGKRVNYACRSVITPDPYLDVDEIGIPQIFAKRLTFAEPVNYLNAAQLRQAIRRGPDEHPGAAIVETSDGKKQRVREDNEGARMAMAKRVNPGGTAMPTTVYRHLLKGDNLLMNRQPSLHKPSIMGHRAKVLVGQRALRMNYAPCKAYNADFDGDEMNGHFVQNRVAQAEVAELANVGSNYLVPKDGTPILGLIQDHVVSGVLLTLKDRFFNREDFMHLVLAAFSETTQRLKIPPPTILKPEKLWTGKQVVTAILLNNIPDGCPPINLTGKAKTGVKCWQVRGHQPPKFSMSESEVIIRGGELLNGVLDKAHYGATQFGLIHCCYELYGHRTATKILSCFSRLFTTYLQFHGFTLGVADILLTKEANAARSRVISDLRQSGKSIVCKTFNLDESTSDRKIKHVLATAYNNPRKDRGDVKQLDFSMKQAMGKYGEQINDACVPTGLIRSFPDNALQLMIQSGAKGTTVNSIQISCALGQIELEGQRPPLSAVGRTLPSFKCFDPSPRAGGYVDQRFLTGINPQELFFHTMAGREGLIDTAVKTSRSGYLQRCIIKHLEGLVVKYDHTVRDHDNSVVQFRYGEDGLDVGRATFLHPNQYGFLEQNLEATRSSVVPRHVRDVDWNFMQAEKHFKRIKKWRETNGNAKRIFSAHVESMSERLGCPLEEVVNVWNGLSKEEREEYKKVAEVDRGAAAKRCPDSTDVKLNPAKTLGALPEKLLFEVKDYAKKKQDLSEQFKRAIYWKGLRALADPGENVGLLAAQSIGEPSTQMTLNTFHFAGRGEMNVTLGIPRLREILMTGSENIATPMTEICVRKNVPEERIERLKAQLNPVHLKQVIKKFVLEERVNIAKGESWRRYVLGIQLLKNKTRDPATRHLSRAKILREIEQRFAVDLARTIDKKFKDVNEKTQQILHRRLRGNPAPVSADDTEPTERRQRDEGASSDEEAEGGREADAAEQRLNQRHQDDAMEYEGEEQDQGELVQRAPEALNIEDDLQDLDDDDIEDEAELEDEDVEAKKQPSPSATGGLDETVAAQGDDSQRKYDLRINTVRTYHKNIYDYNYDTKESKWCTITYQFPLNRKLKLDVVAIVAAEVDRFVVHQTKGIEKCILREDKKDGQTVQVLQTQGINVPALFRHADILDVNTLYSNDIHLMLNTYGVEACTKSIVKEMRNVFGVYGIEVNPRHLTLTADYMTFTGRIQPFSRGAMSSSASPLQKMTFETTVTFMRDSIVKGDEDYLQSPSSRLVTGQMIRGGTGTFELLADPKYILGIKTAEDEEDE
ncbi:DNA-directed RNA polymerase I subunit A1 [Aphelenchoides avenae]|nr:DNA-directed RNA polymerase I subunit A1 [Aphelenchus avenae]